MTKILQSLNPFKASPPNADVYNIMPCWGLITIDNELIGDDDTWIQMSGAEKYMILSAMLNTDTDVKRRNKEILSFFAFQKEMRRKHKSLISQISELRERFDVQLKGIADATTSGHTAQSVTRLDSVKTVFENLKKATIIKDGDRLVDTSYDPCQFRSRLKEITGGRGP